MGKYNVYEKFLPNKFINRKKEEEKKSLKNTYIYLMIVNIILFPVLIDKIGIGDKDEIIIEEKKSKSNIYNLVDIINLLDDNVVEGEITNSSGSLKVSDFKKIEEIEDCFVITKVENMNKGIYNIEVIKNE